MNIINLALCEEPNILRTILIIKYLIKILFIIVPILIIFMAVKQLTKVIFNPSKMNDNILGIVKKIIAGLIIFFIPGIVKYSLSLVNFDDTTLSECLSNANQNTIKSLEEKKEKARQKEKDKDLGSIKIDNKKNEQEDQNTEDDKEPEYSAKIFLNKLNQMSKTVEKDASNGNTWTYGYIGSEKTFQSALEKTRHATCVTPPIWALIEMGVLEEGDQFNKNKRNGKSYISFFSRGDKSRKQEVTNRFKEKLEFIDGNKEKSSKLIEKGILKAGDIVFWENLEHVSVYAGNYTWYDAGRVGVTGYWKNGQYKFKTWGPIRIKGAESNTVYKIGRIKS